MNTHSKWMAALIALALAAGTADAQPQGQSQDGQRRGPPPQAIDACKSLKTGDACSFTGPHGDMQGTCFAPPDKALACRPANAPQGPNGGRERPPQ